MIEELCLIVLLSKSRIYERTTNQLLLLMIFLFRSMMGKYSDYSGQTARVKPLLWNASRGLRHQDSGTIKVLGLDPQADASNLKKQIGSQLQESALPDRIKVWEALDLFASTSAGSVELVYSD